MIIFKGIATPEPLPKSLAGWQALADDVAALEGDLFTWQGAIMGYIDLHDSGRPVSQWKEWDYNVYRRIPVSKQGYLDHEQTPCFPSAYATTSTESMHEHKLPSKAESRKNIPICTGVLDYFPLALIEVAKCSKAGNDQHNPGKPLHWDRSKSGDESDALLRHLMERGTVDTDGVRHSAKVAWRALALLQKEMETLNKK